MKKPHCYNCIFAGQPFKNDKLTHLHCADPSKYNQETFDKGEFTAWDTLRVFSDKCDNHKFKEKIKDMRYLIITNLYLSGQPPFLTNYFEAENNFNSEIDMVVYDLYLNKYTADGKNWYNIEIDHL